jgi:hypothetical protein
VNRLHLLLTCVIIAIAAGCKDSVAPTSTSINIYLAGVNGQTIQYWKDTVSTTLDEGPESVDRVMGAMGMTISGSDVYVCGFLGDATSGKSPAIYWKNNTLNYVTDGTYQAAARSIVVINGDVHVAGYESNGTNWVAKYWKNGAPVVLTGGAGSAEARGVFISGQDVHVAGYETIGGVSVAKYWKNSVETALTDGVHQAFAQSLVVSGDDVYVVGGEQNDQGAGVVKYWKNGVGVSLTDGTQNGEATSIVVSGSNVYVAGLVDGKAAYWKNGVRGTLDDYAHPSITCTFGTSIALDGNDVYVLGQLSTMSSVLWKNGHIIKPFDGSRYLLYPQVMCVPPSK